MAEARFTIWCNAKLSPRAGDLLQRGVERHHLLFASQNQESVLVGGGHDPGLESADIAFGQPNPMQVMNVKRLRWVQLTSAGYTRYDTAALRESFESQGKILTNASGVFDEPCAEHVMAMMYALARLLPESLDEQRGERQWTYLKVRARQKLLVGQNVLLVGFGAIAQRLVELLLPLRMEITAVRRTPTGTEPVPTRPTGDIDALLPEADHVINILPESRSTDRFFDARRFGLMRRTAHFYNIGRGTTVDQDALVAALTAQQIGAAYLDVFDPEPLPPDHPLWTTPNCYITPHTGGGHEDEQDRLVQHFLDNLKRFEAGADLKNRVV